MESTISSVQPFSSSTAYIALNALIYVLPSNSDRPPPLLPSNLYVQPPNDPSYHPDVKNSQIYSTFEVTESSTHSNHNVQASSRIVHQQLEGLRQQITALEATLKTTSNISLPMYSENPVNSFPNWLNSFPKLSSFRRKVEWQQLFLMVSVSKDGPRRTTKI